jgi:hypothetical protein
MAQPPTKLDGWTQHAKEEFADILGKAPSDQQMRELLQLWRKHSQRAFLNQRGRWQVKVFSKSLNRALWLVAGEKEGLWLLWTVFEVE